MRVVLDTTILVRATEASHGLARHLLLRVITKPHVLLLSNEILYELGKVLRYPRMQALLGLPETRVYDYIAFLSEASEVVTLNPLLSVPIRDVSDIAVVQTAIIGEADVICTTDADFYAPAIVHFLAELGIEVMDDITLMKKTR